MDKIYIDRGKILHNLYKYDYWDEDILSEEGFLREYLWLEPKERLIVDKKIELWKDEHIRNLLGWKKESFQSVKSGIKQKLRDGFKREIDHKLWETKHYEPRNKKNTTNCSGGCGDCKCSQRNDTGGESETVQGENSQEARDY